MGGGAHPCEAVLGLELLGSHEAVVDHTEPCAPAATEGNLEAEQQAAAVVLNLQVGWGQRTLRLLVEEQTRGRSLRWRECVCACVTVRCLCMRRALWSQRPTHTAGCDPGHTGPAFSMELLARRKGWGVGGRWTHLVHLAQLLLQVLLRHASQARVDHLNNLPERPRREKLRYGGERRAKWRKRCAVHEGRGAQTACAAAVGS